MLDHLEGGEGERLRGMIEGGKGEGRGGVGWGMERLVVVGRKVGGGEGVGRKEEVVGGGVEKMSAGTGVEGGGGEKEGGGKKVGDDAKGTANLEQPSPSPSPSESALVAIEQKDIAQQDQKTTRRRDKWVRIWKRLNFSR